MNAQSLHQLRGSSFKQAVTCLAWFSVLLSMILSARVSAYAQSSPPSRPILFVHGFCGSAADFQPLLGPLYQQLDHSLYPSSALYYVRYDNAQHILSFFDSSGNSVDESSIPSNVRFFAIEFYDPIDDTTDPSHVAKISVLNKAYEIDQAIKQITAITHVKDVILVAHSMGGLDARAYIENMASPTGCYDYINDTPYYISPQCAPGSGDGAYAGDVGDLITVDTPHLGSPLAAAPNLPGACFLNSSTNKTELELEPLGGSGLIEALNYNGLAIAEATPAPYTAPTQAIEDYFTDVGTAWTGVTGESDDIVPQPSQSIVLNIPSNDTTAPLKDVQESYLSTDTGIAGTPGCWYPFAGLNFQVLHFMPCLGAQPNTQSAIANQVIAHDTGTLTKINVTATYNGAPWSGNLNYQISGPNGFLDTELTVPSEITDVPLGIYTLSQITGGPSSAGTPTVTTDPSSSIQNGQWAITFTIAFPNAAPSAPTATTGSATSVSSTNASLNGTVNPNGAATQYRFLYGTSQTLAGASVLGPYSLASGTGSEPVYATLSGLSAGKTYYYELQAWNSANSSSNPTNGGILSFATPSAAKSTPLVSVAPSSQSITTTQLLAVSVAVVGNSATPTGSVALSGGGYSSSAPLANGSVIFNISAGQLLAGSDTLTATYTPDSTSSSIYNSSTGNTTVSVTTPGKVTPTVSVSPLSTSITTAQTVTVNVLVSTSSGPSPTGTVTVTIGSYTSQAMPLTNANTSVIISGGSLSPGTYTPTAHYSGDTNFNSASGTANNSVTVTAAPTATLTVSVTGSGTVTSTDAHINCPGTCSYGYAFGTSVLLKANEASGYYDQWSGCDGIDGVTGDCMLTMTQSRSVSIVFTQQPKGIMLVQPSGLTFSPQLIGTSNIGTSSDTQTEYVIANGLAALDPISASVGGPNASDFAMTNNCPAYGLNSGECTISVTFTPSAIGTRTASLTVSSANATVTPQVMPLSGAGVVNPSIVVTPSSTAIPESQSMTFDVSVSGDYGTPTGSLRVNGGGFNQTGIALTGGNAVINIPGGSLSPGSDAIWIYYDPDTTSSTIYNYASATVTVTVAGATSYSAPSEPIGTQSPAQTATILFANSVTPGSITATTLGATNLEFNLASGGTCAVGTAYTAGQTCTVNYTFTPSVPGTRMGAINVYDNASQAPHLVSTVYVSGIGTGPQVAFSPGVQSTILPLIIQENPGGIAVDGSGNLYIADYDNNEVLKETLSGGKYAESTIGSSWNQPRSIAVDGAGVVYVAESGMNRVVMETPSGGSYVQSTVASDLGYPSGVAVDGSGNVYIADSQNNQILMETLTASGYVQSTIPSSGLSWPNGIAVDGSGDIYIADQYNNRVLKETFSDGSYTQSTIIGSLNNPRGVAVDPNGDVYIADSQDNQVLEETPSTSGYVESMIGSGVSYPCWVTLDGSGNLFISGYNLLKEDVSDPPSVSFESTASGSTSADSPKTITLANIGNAPLTFQVPSSGSNPSISANFTVDKSTTCPQLSQNSAQGTLAAGANCNYALDFSPTGGGNVSGSLVVSDNNLNAANGVQTITLSGIGTWVATITVNPASSSITTTQVLPVTITVSGGAGSPTPTGTVTISSGSYTSAAMALSGGSATINVPAGSLAVGSDTLTATYTPDSGSSSIYTAATGTTSSAVTVTATAPTVTVTPGSTSITTTQALSVTVTVSAGTGSPTATGTVKLSSGSYASAATALSGGTATINIPAASLAVGSDTLSAAYTPDSGSSSIYTGATGTATSAVTVSTTAPTVTVTPGSSSITTIQALSVTVAVSGGAGSPTATGTVKLSSGSYTSAATALSGGTATINIPAGSLAVGSDTLSAAYTPDSGSSSIYTGATGTAPVTVTSAQAATPTFSPAAGTYTSGQSVTISDTTSGTAIYYTTNGTTPTTSSTLYSSAITVSSTETLEAIATASGYTQSGVATATYTINIPANPVPVISGLSPAYASAGSAAFTLTVKGSGFITTSTVYWGSTALSTQYGSATQLTAQVTAAQIAAAGIAAITVQTPAPGGGTSNSFQFEVDSAGSGTPPTFTTVTATVNPGSTAAYPVTLPSSATDISATCLNLPSGATCSYSSTTNTVTITTSSTTPAGTYQITVVFTETLPGAATAFVVLPILLLPLLFLRRKLTARGLWFTASLGLILMTAAAFSTGCGGGGSGGGGSTPPQTHQVTSSGSVSLIVQ